MLFPTGKPNANLEGDALHLNHVEALSPELAPAFPMFKAGDLLVSLRRLNLLMVIDPVTETVKWTQTGPWMRQHDPHFEASGKILVYDNRSIENYNHEAEGRPAMASRILEFDPRTEQTEVLYEGSREEPFYVFRMGKNQRLPNGNILVTEPDPGRAFELAPAARSSGSSSTATTIAASPLSSRRPATRPPTPTSSRMGRPAPHRPPPRHPPPDPSP